MSIGEIIAYSAALFSCVVALLAIVRRQRSLATWFFTVGMFALAVDSLLSGLSLRAVHPDRTIYQALFVRSILPAIWLAFSLAYSRGNYREFLVRWRYLLIAAFILHTYFPEATKLSEILK